ncbi:MAG: hypothetical protein EAZ97_08275 [Bacteroidetes bacterium]|nr:MAG: hypothetical protein EAZ97_08275 [Bacteroidota bacterium]
MIQVKNRQISPPNSLSEKRNYDGEDVKIALSNLSTGCKCVYCERLLPKLDEKNTDKLRAIEHFYPKELYPNKKFEWKNLFWICKNCNSKKLYFDTGKEPFVHPENDNPEDYFEYDACHQIKPAQNSPNKIASENTIEKTMTSGTIRYVSSFFEMFIELQNELEKKIKAYKKAKEVNKRNLLKEFLIALEDLRNFGDSPQPYAGRRRFLIRCSNAIQEIIQEINNNLELLNLTEPFEWKW